ncbi:MAG TPA: potassium/proton antiporter, partial [Porphyromonadaceae bacterium]|nr:potassium/proton antiporter [Porphyromonadaceae bacterium]
GVRLMDIDIPEHTLVVMIKRQGIFFIPRGNSELMVGDIMLIISDDEMSMEGARKVIEAHS